MNKAIIVGANGFIGSQLISFLKNKDVEIYALVAKGTEYSILPQCRNIRYFEFELSSIKNLAASFENDFDVLFHLAWVGVNPNLRNDYSVQTQNIIYGLDVMEFARSIKARRVVVAGSASEYAYCNEIITGNNIPAPSDMYSASKVATHYLCKTFANNNNIDLIWTSISSVYGPGRDDNNLISYTIKSLLNREKPKFTKLEQKWDYIYISDLIEALYYLGKDGKGGKNYPIGFGTHKTMREYVEIIRKIIDPDLPIGIGDLPYKGETIDNQMLDISDLKKDTGFTPKYTFEKGILNTIDYFRNKYNL